MKHLLLLLAITPLFSNAQNPTKGKITYQQTVKIEFDESRLEGMTDEMKNKFKERMKNWGKHKKVLLYTPNASLYRDYDKEKDAKEVTISSDDGNMHMRWSSMRPDNKIYKNLKENRIVEQKDLMGKKFLIKQDADSEDKIAWKMTGKAEEILGYNCQQAVYQKNDSTTITAWFTSQIPVASGPDGLGQLPGMILKTDRNDGEAVTEVINVEFTEPAAEEMIEPTKGKEVTRDEFKAIAKAKREEMREMYGGGGGGDRHIYIAH